MAAGDLFWNAVCVAMHMDDAGLTDVKGNTLTLSGGVTRSATQSKFGGYSAYFDGVDDEVTLSSGIYELTLDHVSFQFFVYPETQAMANPCAFAFRNIKFEYKPTGYAYGFVIDIDGVKTPLGVHTEGSWYFFWGTITNNVLTLYINDLLIGTFQEETITYNDSLWIGSASLSSNADSAFVGYVDDLLITREPDDPILGSYVRTDHSIPTAAFLEREPDPEGPASGSLSFTGDGSGIIVPFGETDGSVVLGGTCTGIVALVGVSSGSVGIECSATASVPCAGIGSGRVRFTGLGAGTLGRFCFVDGQLRFTGSAVGSLGRLGVVSGAVRFTGSGQAKLGGSGVVSGALQLTGSASGSTPMLPVGDVAGALRFTGNAVGVGGVVEDYCA